MNLTIALAGSSLAIASALHWGKSSTMLYVRSSLLVCTVIFLGSFWHHQYWNAYPQDEIGYFASETPKPAVVKGISLSSPSLISARVGDPMDLNVAGERSLLITRVTEIRSEGKWKSASGLLQVTVNGQATGCFAGNEIVLKGFLSKPPRSRSLQNRNLRFYYRAQRINAFIFVNHADGIRQIRNTSIHFPVARILDSLKMVCQKSIDQNLSPRSSKLLSALLLGERHRVSSEDREIFLITGTMHLLAISGLHVGILCLGIYLLIQLGIFSQSRGLTIMIVLVVTYCLLTGTRIPVLRATVLVVIFCCGKLLKKNPSSVNSLSLAGLVILIINPAALFLPGTQLSFVAVATLIMIGEREKSKQDSRDSFDRFLDRKKSSLLKLKDSAVRYFWLFFASSFGIWITTTPLVLQHFHVVSLAGILVNVVLMIPVSILLNLGFLMVLFDLIGCSKPVAATVEYFADVVEIVIEFAAKVPVSHYWASPLDSLWMTVFYLGFGSFFFISKFRLPLRYQLTLVLIWLALALILPGTRNLCRKNQLVVTFIDVGHGTSVLVEFPGGSNLLYDAGSLNSSRLAVDRISALLWEKRILVLDAVMISHADLDHYNAVPGLAKRFKIKRLLVSHHMLENEQGKSWQHLVSFVQSRRIPVLTVDSQSKIIFDEHCKTAVIHPGRRFVGESDNANSLVLDLQFLDKHILLPGDLESNGQNTVLETPPVNYDIMMAPHHGSRSSDHWAFGQWANPEYVVISCTQGKLNPEIVEGYQSAGAKVYSTSRFAAISFTIDALGIKVNPFLQ
ncbi:MAG: ComEC/Rec2 family competence protein [Planctomycetota bacterium]|nr:ComEC/Rec2 family competence protein [Planctomycetota bacterium]